MRKIQDAVTIDHGKSLYMMLVYFGLMPTVILRSLPLALIAIK